MDMVGSNGTAQDGGRGEGPFKMGSTEVSVGTAMRCGASSNMER